MSRPETPGTRAEGRPPASDHARGLAYALGAYGIWGVIPIYFKAAAYAPPLELLSHRVVWAFAMLVAVGARSGLLAEVKAALASGRTRALLGGSTTLIAVNWLVYIWAVLNGHIMEASLGYFMTPLMNVLLGVLVLRERLPRPVAVALLLATGGVVWLSVESGRPPGISFALALSFGLYGLLRKLVRVGALAGLTVETALLFPLALAYLGGAAGRGTLAFRSGSLGRDVLLVLAGPITAIPLLLFAGATRRLPLSSMGFLQYLSPTLQFLLATFVYGEPFTHVQAVAFGLIWSGLVVFAVHTVRRGTEEPGSGLELM